MSTAFVIDLALVLYLELTRGVVESIPGRDMASVLPVHLVFSTAVLVFYAVQIATGIRLARGVRSRWHARVPAWFVITRVGTFITSFFVAG